MPYEVYGYTAATNKFDYFATHAEWRAQMTSAAAKTYLVDHLKQSLVNDVQPYLDITRDTDVGYFASARMLFPYLNFLGALYAGKDKSENAIDFMEEYLGRRGTRPRRKGYITYGQVIFQMYRHGLVHTHMPKVFVRSDGKHVGWGISKSVAAHLTPRTIAPDRVVLVVCAEALYHDLLDGIDAFVADFDHPTDGATRLDRFTKGFFTMAKVFGVDDPPMSDAERALFVAALNQV